MGLLNNNDLSSNALQDTGLGGKKAVLYLKSPRRFYDTAKRPIRYNFGMEFKDELIDEITNNVVKNHRNVHRGNVGISKRLSQSPVGIDAVKTSAMGIPVASSIFSSTWTFMLVIDNDTGSFNGASMGKFKLPMNENNRCVYVGYTTEEPVNMVNHGQGNRINENCMLCITHKVLSKETKTFGPTSKNRLSVIGDVDFISRDSSTRISDCELFKNTPSSLSEMFSFENDGMTSGILSNITEADSLRCSPLDTHHIKSSMNIPSNNCKAIIDSLLNTLEYVATDDYRGTLAEGSRSLINIDDDYISEAMLQELSARDSTNVAVFGLADSDIFMSELISKYDPKVVVINNKNSARTFDPMDQLEINEVNIYSSMISRSLPSILNNCGLIDLSFSYASDASSTRNTGQISLDVFADKRSAWQIRSYSTLAPLSGGEAKARVETAMKMIEEYIFNPIVMAVGNIDVDVSAYSTDDTYIKLRLLDRDSMFNNMDTPYTEHSCLGGINTPLVADSNIVFENGTDLMALTRSILTDSDYEAF